MPNTLIWTRRAPIITRQNICNATEFSKPNQRTDINLQWNIFFFQLRMLMSVWPQNVDSEVAFEASLNVKCSTVTVP
jgi:hypothetical protein